jgi:redox-sensitive bicupin YhaK (pirin superfamily)
MGKPKEILAVQSSPPPHWVGDGFPVRGAFGNRAFTPEVSPFLLLDFAGPAEFPPSEEPRGVGQHPHRGFETVTIVYQGEVEHRDSAGNAGAIGPGDVQWMTAASGVLHEEKHGREFTRRGGVLEMAQLWVNLPASAKMSPPRYQTILDRDVPAVPLPGGSGGAGIVRVIAGDFQGTRGPARTVTPVSVWDLRLKAGGRAVLTLPDGFTTIFYVAHGGVVVNGSRAAGERDTVLFSQPGEQVEVEARLDSTLLVLSGEPIREPIASYGPFVMNTQEEIRQAIADFQAGRMGSLG